MSLNLRDDNLTAFEVGPCAESGLLMADVVALLLALGARTVRARNRREQFLAMEKERRVRDAMKQMGMRPAAHWLAWFLVCVLFNLAVTLILVRTGLALGIELFSENAFTLYFLLFLLTTTAMSL